MKIIRCIVLVCAGCVANSEDLEAQGQYVERGQQAWGISAATANSVYGSGYAISVSRSFSGTFDVGLMAGRTKVGQVAFGTTEESVRWIGLDLALFPVKGVTNGRLVSFGVHWSFQRGTHTRSVQVQSGISTIYETTKQPTSESTYGVALFDDLNGGPVSFWQIVLAADASGSHGVSPVELTLGLSLRSEIFHHLRFVVSASTGVIFTKTGSATPFGLEIGAIF